MLPVRILLVDDDEDDYILTKEMLSESSSQKYELSWSNNYNEAIKTILREQHDIFLVDYRLGKQSGTELLKEVMKYNCSKPVIILTGKGDSKIDQEALRLGAADYLVKGEINSLTLERAIRYAIEHSKALQKVKESETNFRIIFERSVDPMLISDSAGNIYEANAAALSFFGCSKEILLSKKMGDLFKDAGTQERFLNLMEEKGSVLGMECEFIDKSENVRLGHITSFLQIRSQGSGQVFYSMIRDLTKAELEKAHLTLEEKLSALERMARNLAHEFYNPLSNINLAIDELKMNTNKQEDLLILDIIKKNCDHIDQLTSWLIDSTKPSVINFKEVDLSSLLKSVSSEMQSQYNIEIAASISEGLRTQGDAEKLTSVFQSLLRNALEAIKEDGKVLLKTIQTPQGVVVEVTDNGEGISSKNLSRVFEPFFTTKNRSYGLGLTYTQKIVFAHHGKIDLVSNRGQGTSVSVCLRAETGKGLQTV